MDCMSNETREEAINILAMIGGDESFEFRGTNEDRDFVANCVKSFHVHWPVQWIDRLRDIADRLY